MNVKTGFPEPSIKGLKHFTGKAPAAAGSAAALKNAPRPRASPGELNSTGIEELRQIFAIGQWRPESLNSECWVLYSCYGTFIFLKKKLVFCHCFLAAKPAPLRSFNL